MNQKDILAVNRFVYGQCFVLLIYYYVNTQHSIFMATDQINPFTLSKYFKYLKIELL